MPTYSRSSQKILKNILENPVDFLCCLEYKNTNGGNTMNGHEITDLGTIRKLVVAGKAIFTLVSKATGKRFTYKVNKKEANGAYPETYFLSVFTGTDNTAWNHYTLLGMLDPTTGNVRSPRAERIASDTPSAVAVRWYLDRLFRELPITTVEYWHEGKCARCGRVLTVPDSIAAGVGPECINYV